MAKRDEPSSPELKHPSTKRAKEIDSDTPYSQLLTALDEQNEVEEVTGVAHWFRSKDLRIQDNIALHHASTLAQGKKKPLITFYLNCPPELEWHGTSPARTDLILETLRLMQSELEKLNIPLVVLTADNRKDKIPTVEKFLQSNKISHVFANYEYEVDELRRDIKLLSAASKDSFQVSLFHDQTILEPGAITTDAGKPMKVFTPYHRSWLATVKSDPSLLDTVPDPQPNPSSASKDLKALFDSRVPRLEDMPKSKQFETKEHQHRIRSLWPPGQSAGMKRLNHFVSEKITDYAATRSNPAADSSSRMSAYFSTGIVSVRQALSAAKSKANNNSADFSSGPTASWVREIVFRELYRQTTAYTPHTTMNMPQNLKFDFVEWEDDREGWEKWKNGTTGVPFVDAGMRQLAAESWMHNRLRMNVSSYLYCNLLLDYRRGERFFAENLVDWDLSNNTQGWEPSYTVFNPTSQAERNDPDGEYIRRWVPELKGVKGKAVFEPHKRLSKGEFEKLGYPEPHVDWAETKKRAVERFKNDMAGVEP